MEGGLSPPSRAPGGKANERLSGVLRRLSVAPAAAEGTAGPIALAAPGSGWQWKGVTGRYRGPRTARFALAGVLGFCVTEIVLTLGLWVRYGNLGAQFPSHSFELLGLDVLSLFLGVSSSFVINERITVRVPSTASQGQASRASRFLRFQAVSWLGNAGIIVVQLALLALWGIAAPVGTVVGAVVTYPVVYLVSIRYVWRGDRRN
jgi:putative flippase GtrA